MKLLLDTCALLWLVLEPQRLSATARAALAQRGNTLSASAFSALEIAIKFQKQRLTLPSDPTTWFPAVLVAYGIDEVPVTAEIALRAPLVNLPHGDPADRVIVATALVHGMVVVTGDAHILACPDITVVG